MNRVISKVSVHKIFKVGRCKNATRYLKNSKRLTCNHVFKFAHSLGELRGMAGQFWQMESAPSLQHFSSSICHLMKSWAGRAWLLGCENGSNILAWNGKTIKSRKSDHANWSMYTIWLARQGAAELKSGDPGFRLSLLPWPLNGMIWPYGSPELQCKSLATLSVYKIKELISLLVPLIRNPNALG